MTPYYQEDGITIYHGHCCELLDVRADLLLTDPPYGLGAANHDRANSQRGKSVTLCRDYGTIEWDEKPVDQSLIDRLVKTSSHAVVWGGNYYAMPPTSCWLVWDKDNGTNGYADCELAWTSWTVAVRRLRYRWQGMLQENMARKEVRTHPNQKPLAVFKWALSLAPNAPRTIFDPFMGSGTTLRAAKDLGLKATGCDLVEKYCEIAANRLRQEVLAFAV